MKLHPNIKYRSDIDGLRALAVISVIFFHIKSKWLSGGFLGVDIFFVISGYLITLILIKEVSQTNNINIVNFYKRRLKRIVPALLFMIVPVGIVGFMLMAPDDLLSLFKSMVWAFFSAANIYFYSSVDSGYFATISSEFPLLHLWSLGIEEQFYIVWPFALLYILRYIKSVKIQLFLVGILFSISLLLAQLLISEHHVFTYYMLPTRAWELLGGTFIALLVHSGFRTKESINNVMAILGFSAILFSFVFVSKHDPVPSVVTLPVILGTMLLLLSGVSHKTYVSRFLSLKLFVSVGLVSYSAYLWHWPILAFLRYALIEINFVIVVIVLVSTFVLATVSYVFVENPLRKNESSTKSVFLYYFMVPLLLSASVLFFTMQGIKHKNLWIFPWEKINANSVKLTTKPAYEYVYNCQQSTFKKEVYTEKRCVYPEESKKIDVFLIGDSNAAHYLGMLRVFAKEYGFSMRNATQDACPMVFNSNVEWMKPAYKTGCTLYTKSIEAETKKYDTIIVGGMWNGYYRKEGFQDSFRQTIGSLSKHAKQVILLGKIPIFKGYSKDCDKKAIRMPSLNCTQKFNTAEKDASANVFLRNIANQFENVKYFGVKNVLCKKGICSPYLHGMPVYYNTGHLSMQGSKHIGEEMLGGNNPMLNVFKDLHL